MLGAGTPDGRPAALPGELARLLEPRRVVAAPDPRGTREEGAVARRTLREQLSAVVTALADELAALGIAASVQHDDLHGGNVLVGPDGDRFFDWGDAVVAHPFGTLTVTFNSIAHKLELPPDDPAFARLEAAYLAAWDGAAPRADLERAASDRARPRAVSAGRWPGSGRFSGLEDDEMDGFGDGVAGWLVEFAGRLGRLRRYSMTSPSGRSSGLGILRIELLERWRDLDATTRLRNHFLVRPGSRTTGARSVEHSPARPRRRRGSRPSACAHRGRRRGTSSSSSGRRGAPGTSRCSSLGCAA